MSQIFHFIHLLMYKKQKKTEFLSSYATHSKNKVYNFFPQVWSKCVWGQPCRISNGQYKICVSTAAN